MTLFVYPPGRTQHCCEKREKRREQIAHFGGRKSDGCNWLRCLLQSQQRTRLLALRPFDAVRDCRFTEPAPTTFAAFENC